MSSGDSRTMPSCPNPPALETAAASSDRAGPPIPAQTIGYRQPSFSVSGVEIVGVIVCSLPQMPAGEYRVASDCDTSFPAHPIDLSGDKPRTDAEGVVRLHYC
jgi:hypothetical protein